MDEKSSSSYYDVTGYWNSKYSSISEDESLRHGIIIPKIPLEVGWFRFRVLFERAYFTNLTNYHTVYYTVYDVDEEVLVTSKTNSKVKKVYGEFQIEIKYNKW